jgi:hypothetical protein
MTLHNAANYASTSGIRLAPQDESQTTLHTDTTYNTFNDLYVNNFSEGIVLRPGPTFGGQDSYCYYNTFINIVFYNCVIGLWLKEPPTQPGSGSNRNTFISMRFGSNYNSNTGIQIDAANTCKFISCSFEGIQYGTYPNATPTAIYIAYNTASFDSADNMFFGTIVEACTRGVYNINDRVEFHGSIISDITTTYPLSFWTDPRYGMQAKAIGTGRTPTSHGDFYGNSTDVVVKAVTATSGAAEFRIDTAANYGYYSFYSAAVKKWSFGSIATGPQHLTFFNASDAQMGQFTTQF